MRTWEAELRQSKQVHAVGDVHVLGVRAPGATGDALPQLHSGPLSLLPEGALPVLTQHHVVRSGRLTVLLHDKRRHEDRQHLWIQKRRALDSLPLGNLGQAEMRVSTEALRCPALTGASTACLLASPAPKPQASSAACAWLFPPAAQDDKTCF